MSKVTFETELNDEALGALRSYLAKRNEQLDMRLSEQLEKLYAATVPAAVREYLGEKNGTPVRRSAARPRRAAPAEKQRRPWRDFLERGRNTPAAAMTHTQCGTHRTVCGSLYRTGASRRRKRCVDKLLQQTVHTAWSW